MTRRRVEPGSSTGVDPCDLIGEPSKRYDAVDAFGVIHAVGDFMNRRTLVGDADVDFLVRSRAGDAEAIRFACLVAAMGTWLPLPCSACNPVAGMLREDMMSFALRVGEMCSTTLAVLLSKTILPREIDKIP